jgi:hypothetical protein
MLLVVIPGGMLLVVNRMPTSMSVWFVHDLMLWVV